MSIFGLILDAPYSYSGAPFSDALALSELTWSTQAYIWSLITGAFTAAGHKNPEAGHRAVLLHAPGLLVAAFENH